MVIVFRLNSIWGIISKHRKFQLNIYDSIVKLQHQIRYAAYDCLAVSYLHRPVSEATMAMLLTDELLRVKQSELEISSLKIHSLQQISTRDCLLAIFEHHQSTDIVIT